MLFALNERLILFWLVDEELLLQLDEILMDLIIISLEIVEEIFESLITLYEEM